MPDMPNGFEADVLDGMSASALADKYRINKRTVFKYKQILRAQGDLPPTTQQKPEWTEDGNYGDASAVTENIRSVDELKEAIGLDEDVWEVYDSGTKRWEMGAKSKEGRLQWVDGKIVDGTLCYNGLERIGLWSVWFKARRRKLEPVTFVIQPVECPVTFRADLIEHGPVQSSLLWSDPQFGYRQDGSLLMPYHDREVLDLWLQIAAWLQPARIDVLGDILDLTEFTDHFIRDPNEMRMVQPAILEAHWWLRQFREACPNSAIQVHPGNHDARLRKMLLKHLPIAYGLKAADEIELPPQLSPERLLALHRLDIKWVGDYPNDEDWLGQSICVSHGQVWAGTRGRTSRKVAENSDVSTIQGHSHRTEATSVTRHYRDRTETVTAYNIGCSCRIGKDGPPARNAINDWQQSAALVQFTEDAHCYTIIPVTGRSPKEAIVDGRLFVARDRRADLARDLPDYKFQ